MSCVHIDTEYPPVEVDRMMDDQQHDLLSALPWSGSSVGAQPTAEAPVAFMCPALYRAVRKGWIRGAMALLLQQHGAAAASSDDQATGIMRQHGRCDVLELSAEGNTVLHVAAENGHGELIQELYLRFREKIQGLLTCRNSALDTPLHCAARSGSGNEAVKILVILARDCGDVTVVLGCKNEAGDTALHLAARHGNDRAVEALVTVASAVGAELNNAGVLPLYLAVMSGNKKALKSIVSHCKDASCAGPSSQNALHAAVFQSKEMVELLLEWRLAMADEIDCNGSTPLHFASSEGDLSIVRAILRGAPPRTVYRKDHAGGLSALHVAARMGHDDVVKELLKSCPDVAELRDDGGRTFLHAAAKEKRLSVVSLAIKRSCILNAQDREGNTPLHLAVAAGAPLVADTLLRKGKVRADVLNNSGHTAFDLVAESTSYFTMVSLVEMLIAFKAQSRPQRQDHVKPWKCTSIVRGIEKTSDSLTVVAVLIAPAAFAAGFNLPGGYDDNGTTNLKGKLTFQYFQVLDTIAVGTSVTAAILLVYGKTSSSVASCKSFVASLQCIWVSLMSLMLAFYAALVAVASTNTGAYYVMAIAMHFWTQLLICSILQWIRPVMTKLPSTNWRLWWQSRCRWKGRIVIKRQYPLAGSLRSSLFLFTVINVIASAGFGVLYNQL